MNQIYARLDCVENLTRQRHDRDQTENLQNAATVDSCFELVGSRQHGVAQQKVEHQRESSVLPNARGSRFRMVPNSDIQTLVPLSRLAGDRVGRNGLKLKKC